MNRITKLNKLQQEWVDLACKAHDEGVNKVTIMAATGSGKSFVMYKYLYKIKHLIDTVRPKVFIFSEIDAGTAGSLMEHEALKFLSATGKNPMIDFDITFCTYQSMPDKDRDIDIYDEVDKALSAIFSKNIIDSPCKYGLGLTGTVENISTVFLGKVDRELHGNIRQSDKFTKDGIITDFINKGQLMQIIIPCVSVYTLEQGVSDGILSPFKIVRVEHTLDNVEQYVQKWKKSTVKTTEVAAYLDWKNHMQQSFIQGRSAAGAATGRKMAAFLYEAKSKTRLAKRIVRRLSEKNKKIIIFGERIEILKQITDNVAEKDNTQELIDKFNKGEINVIATAKKLERRVTLEGITDALFISYSSSSASFLQRLGRVVRYSEGKTAMVYVIVTRDTLEEKWYNNMRTIKDEKGISKHKIQEYDCIQSTVDRQY